jgi:hypothetical protein
MTVSAGPVPVSISHPNSRYAAVGVFPSGVLLTFEPADALSLGSCRRAREARRRVAGLLRRHRLKVLARGEAIRTTIPSQATVDLVDLLSAIDKALDAFRQERLYPKVVEEILGITSRERRRWTKDGRLPKSGTGSFRRGRQSIHFALHPPQEIARLSKNPEIIAAWRKADAESSGTAVNYENCATAAETIC